MHDDAVSVYTPGPMWMCLCVCACSFVAPVKHSQSETDRHKIRTHVSRAHYDVPKYDADGGICT